MKIYYEMTECPSHIREWARIKKTVPNYEAATDTKDADVIIIYLCAIAQTELNKINPILDKLHIYKEENPKVKIFVGGCASALAKMDEVYEKYAKYIDATFTKTNMADVILKKLGLDATKKSTLYIEKGTAIINVSTGCLRRCSFCKTNYLKEDYHSIPMQQVIDEVGEAIMDHKVLHICLTAENITEYGIDWDGTMHFEELVRKILKLFPKLKILDLMGVTLDELSEDFLIFMMKEPRIQRVQMEVQSFIQAVRDSMNLATSAQHAKSFYRRLRGCKDVMSTIIVGHNGETEENFDEMFNYIKEQDGTWSLSVTPLVVTPLTKAYSLAHPSNAECRMRIRRLNALLLRKRREWVKDLLAKKLPTKAYVHHYDENRDVSVCVMLGQPVEIDIKGKLEPYSTVLVYLKDTGYTYEYNIKFQGSLEKPNEE